MIKKGYFIKLKIVLGIAILFFIFNTIILKHLLNAACMIKVFSVLNRIKVETLSIHSNSLLQIPYLSKVFVRYFNFKAPNYISNSRSFLPKISQSLLLKYGDNAEKCRMLAEHSAPLFFLQCYDDKDSSQMRVALNLKKKNPKKDNLQGILTDSLHLYNSYAKILI